MGRRQLWEERTGSYGEAHMTFISPVPYSYHSESVDQLQGLLGASR